jgi:hypothetical protein
VYPATVGVAEQAGAQLDDIRVRQPANAPDREDTYCAYPRRKSPTGTSLVFSKQLCVPHWRRKRLSTDRRMSRTPASSIEDTRSATSRPHTAPRFELEERYSVRSDPRAPSPTRPTWRGQPYCLSKAVVRQRVEHGLNAARTLFSASAPVCRSLRPSDPRVSAELAAHFRVEAMPRRGIKWFPCLAVLSSCRKGFHRHHLLLTDAA